MIEPANKARPGKSGAEATDEELVSMTLADQDCFLYLVERYRYRLLKYIRRLTNVDREEAEDILQEVFLKIYINLNDFDADLKFSSWVYRIAHNQVISHHRRNQSRPQGHAVDIGDETVSSLAADLDLEKNIDLKLLRRRIEEVLDRLDGKCREILVLRFFEDKNYAEISDILKRPTGTVASMLNKAKREFKNAWNARPTPGPLPDRSDQ